MFCCNFAGLGPMRERWPSFGERAQKKEASLDRSSNAEQTVSAAQSQWSRATRATSFKTINKQISTTTEPHLILQNLRPLRDSDIEPSEDEPSLGEPDKGETRGLKALAAQTTRKPWLPWPAVLLKQATETPDPCSQSSSPDEANAVQPVWGSHVEAALTAENHCLKWRLGEALGFVQASGPLRRLCLCLLIFLTSYVCTREKIGSLRRPLSSSHCLRHVGDGRMNTKSLS